jgi:uncharacterized protein (TIGR02421 family)
MLTADERDDIFDDTLCGVDEALVMLDRKIDWLTYLSPLDNHAMWSAFEESGYRNFPELRYPDLEVAPAKLRDELLDLPVRKVKEPRLGAMLRAKQHELDLQIELLSMRGTEGFVSASIDLFGSVKPALEHEATCILNEVTAEDNEPDLVFADDVRKAAEAEIASYKRTADDIWSTVNVVEDLNSMMMVNHGHMYIDRHTTLPKNRLEPLIAHEVGVHVVTRYNGYRQPLRLLEAGTAHYDPLQEGLGVFAEYLVGDLSHARLRVLAARVLAAKGAIDRMTGPDIFALLHEEYDIPAGDAFDTAVRAMRGGGLTKDACYLRGLRDLLLALEEVDDITFFFLGKFDLGHRHLIEELLEEGILDPPALLPSFLDRNDVAERLERARGQRVVALTH